MRSGVSTLPKGQQKLDVSVSRSVKRGIRGIKETVRGDGDDLADPNSNKLTERVLELNEFSRQVERPSEQADDSEVFYTLTQKGAEMAKRVAAGKGRSANDFVRHLKAAYVEALDAQQEGEIDPSAFDWAALSRRVSKYFKYAPGVSCILGPLDAEAKVKKQVQRLQRKPVGEAVAPTVLETEDLEAQEKRETEKNMESMWQILRKHPDGVGFLELVMNMQSFAQLIENCFTLSFLIHNKRARLAKSENNNGKGLIVFPFNEKAARQDGSAKALDHDRAQFVLDYSTADWEEWKQYVRSEDCLMPHRADHEDDNVEYEPLATEANTSPSPEDDGDNNDGATKRARKAGGCKKRPSNISIKAEVVNEQDQEDQQGLAEDDEGDEEGEGYKGKILKRLGKRRK